MNPLNPASLVIGGKRSRRHSRRHSNKGKRKGNKSLTSWVAFVKKVAREESLPYGKAMKRASVRKNKGEKWMTGGVPCPDGINDTDNGPCPPVVGDVADDVVGDVGDDVVGDVGDAGFDDAAAAADKERCKTSYNLIESTTIGGRRRSKKSRRSKKRRGSKKRRSSRRRHH